MKHGKTWYLLVICFLILSLAGLTSCDLFDDDDDNDDVVDTTDDNLIGTWYRYSRTLDGTSNDFINAKLVLEEDGTGNEYTMDINGDDLHTSAEAVELDITWSTGSNELSIVNSEDQSSLIQGSYFIGSGIDFLRISDNGGMVDVFVRKMDVLDEDFVATWMLDSAYAEGSEYFIYEYPTLIVESNGTVLMGFLENFRWSVNGPYLLLENMTNPNYDNIVSTYHYSENLDSLYLTYNMYDNRNLYWGIVKWEAVYYRYGNEWE